MTVYSAPNPFCNCLPTTAARVVRQLASQGFPGAVLFVNPVSTDAKPAGTIISYADFLQANPGFATSNPIYFQLQVPGKQDYFVAALVGLDLDWGIPAAEALQ